MKHKFKEFKKGQTGMEISDLIFEFVSTLPSGERYNLADQSNRALVSIPSNIIEGCGKKTNLHFAEYLSTTLSSCYEVRDSIVNY